MPPAPQVFLPLTHLLYAVLLSLAERPDHPYELVRRVRERFPALHMTVFKYEEGVDHERLIAIARERLAEGYQAVVANRGEERGADGAQVAWLLTAGGGEPRRAEGKPAIARAVADLLETAPAAGR